MYLKTVITLLMFLMFTSNVLAHGTEQQHEKEELITTIINYSIIFSILLVIAFTTLLIVSNKNIANMNVKTKKGQINRDKLQQKKKFYKWLTITSTILLLLAVGTSLINQSFQEKEISIEHIHGLGYSENGEQITVATHDGLKVFDGNQWSVPDVQKNDYMGFSKVNDGFYSSGHPSPSSDLKNPLGIVRSKDGRSVELLTLYGEVDFHGMAAGYKSHALYVFNPQKNSKMNEVGLYYSMDDTKTWTNVGMKGLDGNPSSMAVHPTKENVVAIGTRNSVYLSENHGDDFQEIKGNINTTALHFNGEGDLIIGGLDSGIKLLKYDMETDKETVISNPVKKEDYILYAAQSPENIESIVIITSNNDIFFSDDSGQSWQEIASEGKTKNLPPEA